MNAPSIIDTAQYPLATGCPPDWASGWGQDRYGVFVEFTLQEITAVPEFRRRTDRPPMSSIAPTGHPPHRADELWQRTCFEAFLAGRRWAAYDE